MTRLAAFLALSIVVFVGAAAVGRAFGPLERETGGHESERAAPHVAGGAAQVEAAGLGIAADGFRLVAARTTFAPRATHSFSFRVFGAERYDVVHTRPMHLIVVRRDLAHFQHVHPRRAGDGSWRVDLRLPAPGVYRAFADFSAGGKRTVLGVDLLAPGRFVPAELSDTRGVAMSRERDALRFDVGTEVEPYLGAQGHLVVLREGDLAYVHTHPETDRLVFETMLPTRGAYRAYLQYKVDGAVRTAEFALEQR